MQIQYKPVIRSRMSGGAAVPLPNQNAAPDAAAAVRAVDSFVPRLRFVRLGARDCRET